jgi:hypothetical protein
LAEEEEEEVVVVVVVEREKKNKKKKKKQKNENQPSNHHLALKELQQHTGQASPECSLLLLQSILLGRKRKVAPPVALRIQPSTGFA